MAKALVVDQALGSEAIEKGMVERRLRRRAQARSSLDRAVELFDAMGASRWATLARAELEGLGQRPAPMG